MSYREIMANFLCKYKFWETLDTVEQKQKIKKKKNFRQNVVKKGVVLRKIVESGCDLSNWEGYWVSAH